MSKSRGYCFTLNNPTDQESTDLANVECAYLVWGREVGESGTFHFQGYIHFKSQRHFGAVKKLIPRAHIEVRKGSVEEAIAYCQKDGDWVEFGTKPMSQEDKGAANKKRCADALSAAKEDRFDDIPADLMIRFYGTFKKIRSDYAPVPKCLDSLANEWRWGPTGTGKTKSAWDEYPDAFCKKANTKWWDGYAGQKVVIIDDVDKYHVALGYEFKIWLDHNPFPAESKGATSMIRPEKIIITSNYHPKDIWQDEQTLEPVLRRVSVVRYGPEPVFPLFNFPEQ